MKNDDATAWFALVALFAALIFYFMKRTVIFESADVKFGITEPGFEGTEVQYSQPFVLPPQAIGGESPSPFAGRL